MKNRVPIMLVSVAAALVGAAHAAAMEGHKVVPPEQIEWGPGPAALPPGAQSAALHGDPAKEGPFALRIKVPQGYHVPPHTHPKPEVVTVISGRLHLGMGEAAERAKAEALPTGSFFMLPPGMAHYVFADEETVIQINANGPWGITYVNPKDDPRQQKTQ